MPTDKVTRLALELQDTNSWSYKYARREANARIKGYKNYYAYRKATQKTKYKPTKAQREARNKKRREQRKQEKLYLRPGTYARKVYHYFNTTPQEVARMHRENIAWFAKHEDRQTYSPLAQYDAVYATQFSEYSVGYVLAYNYAWVHPRSGYSKLWKTSRFPLRANRKKPFYTRMEYLAVYAPRNIDALTFDQMETASPKPYNDGPAVLNDDTLDYLNRDAA